MTRTLDVGLQRETRLYVNKLGSVTNVARFFEVNYGLVYGSYFNAHHSPTLKVAYRNYTRVERTRYCIECTKEERERWDYLRGEMTRHEFFVMLLDKVVY